MGKKQKFKEKVGRNSRYIQNEYKIQIALLKLRCISEGHITVRQVMKLAGMSRQAFYNHYKNVNHAITQVKGTILNALAADLDVQDKRLSKMFPDTNRRIFYAMFIFMGQNKDIFCLICRGINNHDILLLVLEELFPRLQLQWLPVGAPAPDASSIRVKLYLWTMMVIIAWWGAKTDCDISKADSYIDYLLRITEVFERNKLP